MIYFTSDLHLSHMYVAALRGFSDVAKGAVAATDRNILRARTNLDKHDNKLLHNFNSVLNPDDELYVLGDLGVGAKKHLARVDAWLEKLRVYPKNRHFILGNHDQNFRPCTWFRELLAKHFATVDVFGAIPEHKILLSHIQPFCVFGQSAGVTTNAGDFKFSRYAPKNIPDGWLALYGHTHSKKPHEFGVRSIINVGVDAHNLTPVSLETVLKLATA